MRSLLFCLIVILSSLSAAEECYWLLPSTCELIPPWYERICLEGAILYQRVDSEGWEYLLKRTFNRKKVRQHYKDVSSSWAPGYRVGFDWQIPRYAWDFGFHWTHYDARGSNSAKIRGKSGQTVLMSIPLIQNFTETILPGQQVPIRGRIKSRFEIYDFDFSQWCCLCDDVSYFRPIIGVRLLDIHANLKIRSTLGPGFDFYSIRAHIKNEHKGIGFKAGFKTQYLFCDGWSFLGGINGALIWGNAEFKNKYLALASTSNVIRESIRENTRLIRPMLDLHAGVEWCCIVCDCNPLRLRAEWEFHYLFNQFRYFVSNLPTDGVIGVKTRNNIVLQGLSFTGSFEF
jgi:hypothetical protein